MLRDYQLFLSNKALIILQEFKIVYLAWEMRIGKTLSALYISNEYGAQSVLFVTKKKAIASIQADYELLNPAFKIKIINYDSLHLIGPVSYDLIIVDEAHSIGAFPRPAQRARLLKKICKDKPIIYLSGTPTPESYSQLYHQLYISSFSPWIEYPNFYKWAKDYVEIKKKYYYNNEINDYSGAIQEKVEAATSHLFITYTQKQAGFSSFVQEHILRVPMKKTTLTLAKVLKRDRVVIGKQGEEIVADTAVKLMGKMHQIFSGTVLTEDGQMLCFDDSKAQFIAKIFSGKKIAIFYKFRAELELIRWAFKGKITDSPETFNQSDDIVFVSQIQSGREGINLSTAEALVMFNIDFSSLSYIQARARIQTLEREKAANLYWIFAEGGIEDKIFKRVIKKQDYTLSYFKQDYGIRYSDTNKEKIN